MTYLSFPFGAAPFGGPESVRALGIEEVIEDSLFGTVRDLSMFDAAQKAWPNVKFDASIGDAYLRADHLANGNERVFIKGTAPHRYIGILQLTVVSPLNAGPSPATELAAAVAASYPADMVVHASGIKIRIQKVPDVMRAFPTDTSWHVVVSIRYEAFA